MDTYDLDEEEAYRAPRGVRRTGPTVGPARYCSTRRPTHYEPLFLFLTYTASMTWRATCGRPYPLGPDDWGLDASDHSASASPPRSRGMARHKSLKASGWRIYDSRNEGWRIC